MTAAASHEQAELEATRRLTHATWLLCVLTVVLCLVTLMLCQATWAEKQRHEAPRTEEVQQQNR